MCTPGCTYGNLLICLIFLIWLIFLTLVLQLVKKINGHLILNIEQLWTALCRTPVLFCSALYVLQNWWSSETNARPGRAVKTVAFETSDFSGFWFKPGVWQWSCVHSRPLCLVAIRHWRSPWPFAQSAFCEYHVSFYANDHKAVLDFRKI